MVGVKILTFLFDTIKSNEEEFKSMMNWFKEEFKVNFGTPNQCTVYTPDQQKLYVCLMNKMAETINYYRSEPLLCELVEDLNKITRIYDCYMKK